jgi:hypothetical protein
MLAFAQGKKARLLYSGVRQSRFPSLPCICLHAWFPFKTLLVALTVSFFQLGMKEIRVTSVTFFVVLSLYDVIQYERKGILFRSIS